MTNGEKFINDYYPNSSITRDSLTGRVFVNEDNADFTLPIEWWDAEYKESPIKYVQKIDKSAMMHEIYMAGVNMTSEYQGCWVRFKEIEKIVDKYVR